MYLSLMNKSFGFGLIYSVNSTIRYDYYFLNTDFGIVNYFFRIDVGVKFSMVLRLFPTLLYFS